MPAEPATATCPLCDDTGLRVEERLPEDATGMAVLGATPVRVAVPCSCRAQRRMARVMEMAQVPRRYEHCSLDNFEAQFRGSDASVTHAAMTARAFVRDYPSYTEGKGLLLVGTVGVGKTHLAVGILEALVRDKGATGLFCDYRDLLKQIQNSYNAQVASTELEVLKPVFEAEVLVLDELGASKPTDWVWDTVAHILNTRYNDKRTTILTTNYANLPSAGAQPQLARQVREETLGDRIGDRMRSRLQEMCVVLEMRGMDWRESVKKASFGGERFRG